MSKQVELGKGSRWSRSIARANLDACKKSGLSKKAYCEKANLDYPRMVWWARKLQNEEETPRESVQFLRVAVRSEQNKNSDSIEIVLKSGQTVRVGEGFDPVTLQAVVKALEAAC